MPDAYRFPCHPERALDPDARGWKGIGLAPEDGVRRLQARCPACAAHYNAFRRPFGGGEVVEWVRPRPFRVTVQRADEPGVAAAAPLWQDADEPLGPVSFEVPGPAVRDDARADAPDDPRWAGATPLVTPVQPLRAAGGPVAGPGELLLESRRPWIANDRRAALLWSPRLRRAVVAWHSIARLREDS